MDKIKFTYFPEWEAKAALTRDNCNCPDDMPCLEGIFFDDPEIADPVCVWDLMNGKIRVVIPDHLRKALDDSVKSTYPHLDDQNRIALLELKVDLLSRTPPVPWIQHNAWPISNGDFCRYLGEWHGNDLIEKSPNGDGKSFLWNILDDYCRNRRTSPGDIWGELQNGTTAVYVFECLSTGKLIAIDQSY